MQVTKQLAPTPLSTAHAAKIQWEGEVPSQKWMNFYTKFLSKFATALGLKLTVKVEVDSPEGVSKQKVDEAKVALRELGLSDDVRTKTD